MRYKFFLLFIPLLLSACSHRQGGREAVTFRNEVVIPATPVKDQGRSPLCWAYAMLATIESERLVRGDSVNLSPGYLARMWLQEQARTCFLTKGRRRVSLRGMAAMTLDLMREYGMEPYDSYPQYNNVDWNLLCRTAMRVARHSPSLDRLDGWLGGILDRQAGYLPPTLFMLGMGYTPQQFAESVCLPGDYVALTSFTHHPFGSAFVLESPDNALFDTYYNVPIDSLMGTVEKSLRGGHPVCWEGDISEPGFDFANGLAVLSDETRPVGQKERQRAFESAATTDDHCIELCGLARDSHGRLYFLAKNSWGKSNRYRGYMYLSYNYVRLKTVAVVVSREAVRAAGASICPQSE